jgi:hypothetical protein
LIPNDYKEVLGPYVDHCDLEPPVFFFEDEFLVGRFVYNECQVFNKKNFIVWGRPPEITFIGDVLDGECFIKYLHEQIHQEVSGVDITNDYLTLEGRYLKLKKSNE